MRRRRRALACSPNVAASCAETQKASGIGHGIQSVVRRCNTKCAIAGFVGVRTVVATWREARDDDEIDARPERDRTLSARIDEEHGRVSSVDRSRGASQTLAGKQA